MCGRFTLRTPTAELVEIFRVARSLELSARYNIAPAQQVAAVRPSEGGRELVPLLWGLIPSWASDPRIGSRMINARAETAATKPAFRQAIRRRRGPIPADGFYEWQKSSGRGKQPYLISLRDGKPFAMAGLWECWRGGKEGESPPIESCTILTTQANEQLRALHDRMPVILSPEDYDRWLDPRVIEPTVLEPLLQPYPSERLLVQPLTNLVNNVRNDSPDCIRPLETPRSLF